MSDKLIRPPKPEERQNNSNLNGKTIPYPGFEPGTSGLAVGGYNHCTIGSIKSSNSSRTSIKNIGISVHKINIFITIVNRK
jgi:hypothetical protein